MNIGIFYRDINTNVGDSYDVRMILEQLSNENNVVVFCSSKNKHKIIKKNIKYVQTDNLFRLLRNIHIYSKELDFFHLFCGLIYSVPLVSIILNINKINYAYSPFGQLMPEAMKKGFVKKKLFSEILLKPMLVRASFIHANSAFEKSVVENLVNANKIIVSSLAVEGYELDDYAINDDKSYISFIGRLDTWHKGLDILIDAINKNKELVIENKIKFVIAGRATEKQLFKLINLIKINNLEDLIIVKHDISDKDKFEILSKSYYFIHPSRVEGFARSMREAINCEIPIITTYDSNVGDYIKSFDAGFTCNFDANELAGCISQCFSSIEDNKKFGVKALKKHLTWSRIGQDLIKEYNYASNN
jgi:glycosyltransferase involved in cell wall biosynthesis